MARTSVRDAVIEGGEEAHQIALFDWIRFMEGSYPFLHWIYHVPNGGLRSPRTAAKMKRMGQRAGIWDVSCDIDRNGYRGFRFELKYGRNKLTKEQVEWENHYRVNHYLTGVFYTWVDCALAIAEYFGLPEQVIWGLRNSQPANTETT